MKMKIVTMLALLTLAECAAACGGSTQVTGTPAATRLDLPPAWTETPRIVVRTTPSPSPPASIVRTTRPTEDEIQGIPSIWDIFNLSDGLDLEEPGSRGFSVDLASNRPLIWPFYWCASDQDTLAENLASITVAYRINGMEVLSDEVLQFGRDSQDWVCHYWATLLTQWQGGSRVNLTIRYTLSQNVFDGKKTYPAGQYSLELSVTVPRHLTDGSNAVPNIIFYLENAGQLVEFGEGARLMVIHPDGSGRRQIAEGFDFAVSPDASMVAYRRGVTIGSGDEVRVVDLVEGRVIAKAPIPGYCDGFWVLSGFDWSPNNHRVAYSLAQYGLDGFEDACAEPGAVAQRPEDAGVYQIDVTDGSVRHFEMYITYDAPIYKRDGLILYLPVSEIVLDAETGDSVLTSPFDADEFCPGDVRVAQCGGEIPYYGPNLCLFDRGDHEVAQLTVYGHYQDAHPSPSEETVVSEGVRRFTVLPDCSRIVYQTDRKVLPPLTPDPQEELRDFFQPLHVVALDGTKDHLIMENVDEYVITPDGQKIVIVYRRERFGEREIVIADMDGADMQRIGVPSVSNAVVSPTGEELAIAAGGIHIVRIDGSGLRKIADGAGLQILAWR